MRIERMATVVAVDDLATAVAAWSQVLGVEPTFVDGERWAQFDVAGARLALAGTDRGADATGLMLRVDDVAAALAEATELGLSVSGPVHGPHELRGSIDGPGGAPIVVYAPAEEH